LRKFISIEVHIDYKKLFFSHFLIGLISNALWLVLAQRTKPRLTSIFRSLILVFLLFFCLALLFYYFLSIYMFGSDSPINVWFDFMHFNVSRYHRTNRYLLKRFKN